MEGINDAQTKEQAAETAQERNTAENPEEGTQSQDEPTQVSSEGDSRAVVGKPPSIFGGVVAFTAGGMQPSEDILERINEVSETLESLGANISLPIIHFKDDFRIGDDDDVVDAFDGVLIFTKESNVYYEGRYKPGESKPPRCFSPDGRIPTTPDPIHPTCDGCPMNVWGSGPDGNGKACKNTRPLFILTFTQENTLSLIPKVLRVPPTSLPMIKQYILRLAADYGSYYGVRTTFEVYKKSEAQTHHNIRFRIAGRLEPQQKTDVKFVRSQLLPIMQRGNFGVDDETAAGPRRAATPPRGSELTEEAF